MITSGHNPITLLKRILSLAEISPFVLIADSLAQSSRKLLEEVHYNVKEDSKISIIYVSFETVDKPSYADVFIAAGSLSLDKLTQTVRTFLPSTNVPDGSKTMVLIDSMNYISSNHVGQFVSGISSRNSTLLGVYHTDVPEYRESVSHYPKSIELLHFMATTVMEVQPVLPQNATEEQMKDDLSRFLIPRGLNNHTFQLVLTTRRKSGRSLSYKFLINSETHSYDNIVTSDLIEDRDNETPEMLQDLTTFNLTTSAKQKLAKEQVELPFLEAQSFNTGGAIVYQFEKDDDYDEEDPFEDPF
ncbi:hypothetical protein HG536_0A00700 [Torulaspora globosa]|uniref:Elongator complex protein 5 n=1 Tax=Torulaspora globosa TaxID=48254 RepID=A0A7G3Z9R7_9SACH|nr:uncharacterized protein HG536_0A00700 [Torulaspora globosa]QLL30253.1 hypothetical protein HG536_0A00700 [Torulaspora globosa]